MVSYLNLVTALVATAGLALAHPGEKHDLEMVKRQVSALHENANHAKRALDSCSSSLKARQLVARATARRANTIDQLRQKRGITEKPQKFRRDLATLQEFEAVNHNLTGIVNYNALTDASVLFASNASCLLAPDIVDGPYYVTGEVIRSNVIEDLYSSGVPMHIEVQYVDSNTCEPIPAVAVDVWQCNATGVYSGVVDAGMGGLNTTYLRGVQITDEDGVVDFDTIFPGHYSGRAIHTHLLSHMNATLNENNTIVSGSPVSHIGQLFFPDELRVAVEANYPYNTNTIALTTNDEDQWSIVQADTYYDPFPEFVYLGSDVTDGLFVWKQIAINVTADLTSTDDYKVASIWTADGGVENTDPDTIFSGGGGGGVPSV